MPLSHLGPITDLVGKGKKKIEWKAIHQQAFEDIKKVMAKEAIINYPKFGNLRFIRMPVVGNLAQ